MKNDDICEDDDDWKIHGALIDKKIIWEFIILWIKFSFIQKIPTTKKVSDFYFIVCWMYNYSFMLGLISDSSIVCILIVFFFIVLYTIMSRPNQHLTDCWHVIYIYSYTRRILSSEFLCVHKIISMQYTHSCRYLRTRILKKKVK